LFVGTLDPRKNLKILLQAFARVLADKLQDGIHLGIAGGRGWDGENHQAMVEALGIDDYVPFTGFVEDDDLPDLYRGALLLVYPLSSPPSTKGLGAWRGGHGRWCSSHHL
jgi:glycosyltransferase involved in cell wall biosynthesis